MKLLNLNGVVMIFYRNKFSIFTFYSLIAPFLLLTFSACKSIDPKNQANSRESTSTVDSRSTQVVSSNNQRISKNPSIHLAVVGDIMCHASQLASAFNPECQCYEFEEVFKPVKKLLQDPDITIGIWKQLL